MGSCVTIEKGNALLGGHIVNCAVKYNGGKMKCEDGKTPTPPRPAPKPVRHQLTVRKNVQKNSNLQIFASSPNK